MQNKKQKTVTRQRRVSHEEPVENPAPEQEEVLPEKKQNIKHITKTMAMKTAEDIRAYWERQGYTIHVWVERITHGNQRDYAVKSNMKNGRPTSAN